MSTGLPSPLSPIYWFVHATTSLLASLNPILGNWQAVTPRPDGALERISLDSHNSSAEFSVTREFAWHRAGRYRADGNNLHLLYDDNIGRTLPISLADGELVLGTPSPLRLTYQGSKENVDGSLVGIWRADDRQGNAFVWKFRANGRFQFDQLTNMQRGIWERDGNKLQIAWHGVVPAKEQWTVRITGGNLFVTVNGKRTEYEKRAAFE